MRHSLSRLARVSRQHSLLVLLLALLLALWASSLVGQLWQPSGSFEAWLPKGLEPNAGGARGAAQPPSANAGGARGAAQPPSASEWPYTGDLLVIVSGGRRPVARQAYVEQLGTQLRSRPDLFVDVLDQVDLTPLRSCLLYYLTVPQLQGLEQALRTVRPNLSASQSLLSWVALINLSGPQSPGLATVLATHYQKQLQHCLETHGRYTFSSPLTHLLQPRQAQLLLPFWEGRTRSLLSADGTKALVFVRPGPDPHASLQELRRIVTDINLRNPGIATEITGSLVIADEQAASLRAALVQSVFIALSMVLLLLWFGVLSAGRVFCAMLAWATGLAWSAGLGAWWLGQVGLMWMAAQALVAVISGFMLLQTLWLHRVTLSVRIFLSGAVAMWALSYSGQPILVQMGQASALGLLASCLVLVAVWPALEVWRERWSAPPRPGHRALWETVPLLPRGLHASAVLLVTALLCVGCLLWLASLPFQADPWTLVDRRAPSLRTEMELTGSGTSSLFAMMMADDVDSARKLARRLEQLPSVEKVFTVALFLPTDAASKRPVVERICELAKGAEVPQPIKLATAQDLLDLKDALDEAGGGLGMLSTVDNMGPGEIQDALNTFQQGILLDVRRLASLLKVQRPQPPDVSILPASVRDRTVGASGRISLMVFPHFHSGQGAFLEGSEYEDFVTSLARIDPNLSGPSVYVAMAAALSRQAHYWALGLAWLGLFTGLAVQLASPLRAALVMLGPTLAWLVTAGVLFSTGVAPNLINWPVPIIHLILGAALSLECLRRPRLSRNVLGPTLGVLLVALVLMSSGHPALSGLGYCLGVSLAANLIMAMTVIPALQRLLALLLEGR